MRQPILIADDSEDDMLLLQRALQKARVLNPILTVSNGDDAIAYLQGKGNPWPILLLVDSMMPHKSGFDVLNWLRTRPHPKLGVVMLTGATDLKSAFRAYELGADTFLNKPLIIQDFMDLVHAIKGIQIKNIAEGCEVVLS